MQMEYKKVSVREKQAPMGILGLAMKQSELV
jgi:hypothetical protein